MCVEHFIRARRRQRRIGTAARACLIAEPEQVGRCAFEVPAHAIDIEVFDQVKLIPAREFGIGQVGNPAAHGGFRGGLVQAEIQADAAHAFALVGRGGGQVTARQQVVGLREVATVDQVDQSCLACTLPPHVLRRRRRRPQQQHGTQAGSGRQTQFANDGIHGDTSPARVVTAV